MKTAQKIKTIPMLLLLWSLPMSTLPRVVAKPPVMITVPREPVRMRVPYGRPSADG